MELPAADTLVGGSDPWTVIRVTADFTTTSSSFVDVLVAAAGAALGFTPAANTFYEIEGLLLVQTATTTVGPRPGLTWGTGLVNGAVRITVPSSASAEAVVHAPISNVAGTAQCPVGGLPTTAASYLSTIMGTFLSGTTPTPIKVQLASETSGTTVTIKAGSFLRYRIIP